MKRAASRGRGGIIGLGGDGDDAVGGAGGGGVGDVGGGGVGDGGGEPAPASFITNRSCVERPVPTTSKRTKADEECKVDTLYFVPHRTERFLEFSRGCSLLPHPSLLRLVQTEHYRVVTYGRTSRSFNERFKEEFESAYGAYRGFSIDDALCFETAPDAEVSVRKLEKQLKQMLQIAGEANWLDAACGRVAEARGKGFEHTCALVLQRLYLLGLLPLCHPAGRGQVSGWTTETALVSPLTWELLRTCNGQVSSPFLSALLHPSTVSADMVGLKLTAVDAALQHVTTRNPGAFRTLCARGGGDAWCRAVAGQPEAMRWQAVAALTDLELERQLFLATQRVPGRDWICRVDSCERLVAALAAPWALGRV